VPAAPRIAARIQSMVTALPLGGPSGRFPAPPAWSSPAAPAWHPIYAAIARPPCRAPVGLLARADVQAFTFRVLAPV